MNLESAHFSIAPSNSLQSEVAMVGDQFTNGFIAGLVGGVSMSILNLISYSLGIAEVIWAGACRGFTMVVRQTKDSII